MSDIIETRRDRLDLAEDAGLGRVSGSSVLAGVLAGYGAFAVLAGFTAAALSKLHVHVDLSGADLRRAGTASGIVLGGVLFGAWLFGGYIAGRMARRAGLTNGILVFVLGLVIAVAGAATISGSGAGDSVTQGLRNLGIPTSGDQWRQIGTVAGVASLLGMLLGSVLGGALGEHWHSKLLVRALDPEVGPEGVARAIQPKLRRAAKRRQDIVLTDHVDPKDASDLDGDGKRMAAGARAGGRPPAGGSDAKKVVASETTGAKRAVAKPARGTVAPRRSSVPPSSPS
jgi:hypothetical protein